MSTALLSVIATPTSLPPVTKDETAPGTPFFSKTWAMILVTAMAHNGVEGDGFHSVALPAAKDREKFQPYTATGKLKAVRTETNPRGLGTLVELVTHYWREGTKSTLENGMPRPFGADNVPVHHPRQSDTVITLG